MVAHGWDEGTGDLKIDADNYDVTANRWVKDVSPPKKTIPSLQEAYDKKYSIEAVGQTCSDVGSIQSAAQRRYLG